MKISTLHLEIWNFSVTDPSLARPGQELRFRIESADGRVFTLSQILLHEDDLISRFDYLWEGFGQTLKAALLKADEQTEAQGESQGRPA